MLAPRSETPIVPGLVAARRRALAGSWPFDGDAAAPTRRPRSGGRCTVCRFSFWQSSVARRGWRFGGDPSQRCDERRRRRLHRGGLDPPAATPKSGNCWSREHRAGRTAGIWTCPTTRAACGSKQPDRTINPMGPSRLRREPFAPMPGSMLRPLCGAGRTKRGSTSTATRSRKGEIGPANLDNPESESPSRPHSRAPNHFRASWMKCASIAGPSAKRRFKHWCSLDGSLRSRPPKNLQDVTLTLGDRQFSGTLQQPAFLAVRLEAGALPVRAELHRRKGSGPDCVDAARRRA